MLERLWLRLRYRMQALTGRTPPRAVYLHIPKCGGTTIFRHFKDNIGNGRSGRIAHFDSRSFAVSEQEALRASSEAQFVSGHFGWNALSATRKDAFCFTVLREPFARLVSLYRFARLTPQTTHPLFIATFDAAKQRSFGDFCLSAEPEIRAMIDNAMTRALAEDYYPYQPLDANRALRTAIEHLSELDVVIDLPQLNDALPHLAAFTGTKLTRGPHWRNPTPPGRASVISREEFESDAALMQLIAQDRVLYRHAFAPPAFPANDQIRGELWQPTTRVAR